MLYQHLKSLKPNEPQVRFYRYSGLTPPQQSYPAEPVSDEFETQASQSWATQLLGWVSSLFGAGNLEERPIGLGQMDRRMEGPLGQSVAQTAVYSAAPEVSATPLRRSPAFNTFPMLQGGFPNYRFAKIEEAIGLSRQQTAIRFQHNPFRLQ